MNKRWYSTEFLQATPDGVVNKEKGVIEGVSVCTIGEAKGHCVSLDSEFIEAVTSFGNEKKQGLKARFGHPNMCSTALGTFIGRFKNFRVIGDQCKADLFLSNEARDTPHGNLYDYVLGMAENEADMFGTSIVFSPGRLYRRDKGEKVYAPGSSVDKGERGADWNEWREIDGPDYVECDALHACDAVDEPAANDGLFSRFSQETIAGQITEFLDLNPQVWKAVESNPSIVEALARYGDKVDEFIERYRAYSKQDDRNGEPIEPSGAELSHRRESSPGGQAEEGRDISANQNKTEGEQEMKTEEQSDKKVEGADAGKEPTPEATPESEKKTDDGRGEFRAFQELFGDKAGEYFAKGLTLDEAKDEHLKAQDEQIRAMQDEKESRRTSSDDGNEPAGFQASVDDAEPKAKYSYAQCVAFCKKSGGDAQKLYDSFVAEAKEEALKAQG